MRFDAFLHPGALRARDVDDLEFFGVRGALVPCDDAIATGTAGSVRKGWDEAIRAVRRVRRRGVAAWAALGIPPQRIPLRGLEALLAELPEALGRPECAALGAVGLDRGGELEESVLARQLALARELRLPVLVATSWRARERMVRRILGLLRDAEIEPGRVLVAGADARTVRAVRACGHLAGLSLSGDAGGARDPIAEAVRLVTSLGPEGLVLGSDAGRGGGDLLALPRAADRLVKAGLTEAVVRRVCGGNAIAFLGIDLRALGA